MKKIPFLALLVVPLVLGLVVSAAAQTASEPFTYCTEEPEYCQTKIAQVPIPWQFWAIETDTTGVTTVTDRIRISPTWLDPPEGQPAGEGPVLVSRQFATAPTVIPLEELVWDPETNMPIPTRPDLQWQMPPEEQRLLAQGLPPFIEVMANEDDLELDILVTADDGAVLVVYEVKLDTTGPVVGHFINEAELGTDDDGNPSIVQVFVNFDVHNGTGVNVTNFELDFLGLDFTCEDVLWALGFVRDTGDLWGANEENPLVVRPIEGGTEVKWIQPERPLEPSEWLHGGLRFELDDLIDGDVVVGGTVVPVTVQGYWTVLCEGRMTGGGSVLSKEYGRVTHGFELHCDVTQPPNNLQVNWGKGNRFHLTELTWAACLDRPDIDERPPVAGFDTYAGLGKGRYNGEPGATIKFAFTDEGEPGKNDKATMVIFDADGDLVLKVDGNLKNGNHQAHGH